MRTTMTIDDDVARRLKQKRISGDGLTFKEAVNETLRNGLEYEEQLKSKPNRKFELKGRLLRSKMLFNFNKVQQLLEFVDNEDDLK
jgi:hypothetical protein